jgi:hypothetical protein
MSSGLLFYFNPWFNPFGIHAANQLCLRELFPRPSCGLMCISRDETSLETYGFPDFGKPASLFCVRSPAFKLAIRQ